MEIILSIVGFTLLSSLLFIYVMIFGPSEFHRDGLVGRMHYALLVSIPAIANKLAVKILGVRLVNRVKKGADYVLNQANPLLQIFYVFLVTGACIIFLTFATGRIMEGRLTSSTHTYLAPVLIFITYYFFYVACRSDPGRLTPTIVADAKKLYPYDEILFTRKTCETCRFDKPARSKHCSLCHACIARFDHHCAWINNCVGANNTRYFWRFLGMTSVLAFYFSGIIAEIFYNTVVSMDLYNRFFRDPATGVKVPVTHTHVVMYLLHTDLVLSMLLMFASLVGLILFLFLLYHVYLVASGTTTSETFKWEDVRYQIKHGRSIVIGENGRETRLDDDDDDDEGEVVSEPRKEVSPPKGKKAAKGSKGGGAQQRETKQNAKPKVVIDNVKQLKNIYHRGVFTNIFEILFPPKLWKNGAVSSVYNGSTGKME